MYRFTIRELFLATLVAAVGAAWWHDHSAMTESVRQAEYRQEFFRLKANLLEVLYVPGAEGQTCGWAEANRPSWNASSN
jgi:hypothetical protein